MVEFKENTPTISQIYQYTYSNPKLRNRFEYMKRDVLPTKFKIEKRTTYKRNKENLQLTPSERIFVFSQSAPQYRPYSSVKTKGAKRQLKIRHDYDIILCIQPTEDGTYSFWRSKMIWRCGSFKKVPKNIPQNKVKTIHADTKKRIERKYAKLLPKEKKIAMNKEFEKIRRNSPYLNDGDYLAQEYHIMLDFYYRDAYIMSKFNCLYGRCWWTEPCKGVDFPYADKHVLNCLNQLLKRGILKYK